MKDKGPDQIGGLGELTTRFTYAPAQWRIAHTPHAAPSRDAWQAALAALKNDPLGAPLPEVLEV